MGARRRLARLTGIAVLSLAAVGCTRAAAPSASDTGASPLILPAAAASNVPAASGGRIEWTKGPTLDRFTYFAGWSGGYFAFGQALPSHDLLISSSTDGVTWVDRPTLSAADAYSSISIAEGPAGLLMAGWEQGCGEPPQLYAMWLSVDGGRSWSANLASAFQDATVISLAGGPSGYVAAGWVGEFAHSTPVAWTSTDARTWHRSTPKGAPSEEIAISGGVAFSGGFVLAGATWPRDASTCSQPTAVSVWWSADGSEWTREMLPGGSFATKPEVTVSSVSGRVLVIAGSGSGDQYTRLAWISSDGRVWTPIGLPFAICHVPECWQLGAFDDQGLMLTSTTADTASGIPLSSVTGGYEIRGTSVVELHSTGDVPVNLWATARGPKGVLAVGNGIEKPSWLGVPVEAQP